MSSGQSIPWIHRHWARAQWPAVLLAALTISAAAMVVWLVSVVIGQEQAAAELRLLEAAELRLDERRSDIERYWRAKEAAVEALGQLPAPELFYQIQQHGLADAVLLRNSRGDMVYPTLRLQGRAAPGQLEVPMDETLSVEEATQRYASDAALAESQGDARAAAEAWFNVLRAALNHGDVVAAETVAEGFFSNVERRAQVDLRGQCIGPVADALLVQALKDKAAPVPVWLAERMREDLGDYVRLPMPARQRLTLMETLRKLLPDSPEPPTAAAEELGMNVLKADEVLQGQALNREETLGASRTLPRMGGEGLLESPLRGTLLYQVKRGTVLLLLDEARLQRELEALLTPLNSLGRKAKLVPPGEMSTGLNDVVLEVGPTMPGWSLRMQAGGEMSGLGRVRLYGMAGVGCVLLLGLLTYFTARSVSRQLQRAQLQHELAATVSHELKTPLASMRLLVESLLEDEVLDVEKARDYLGLMGQENRRLSRLVENFLTLARLERKGASSSASAVSPGWVADAVARSYGDALSQSRLDVEVAEGLPFVKADADQLVVAVGNLVDNAHKYSTAPRRIMLRVSCTASEVTFAVKDEGCGMTAAERERIWEPFERLTQHAHSVHGCGLGLAIVRRIVTLAQGKVEVESEPGRGSIFRISLPVCADDEEL